MVKLGLINDEHIEDNLQLSETHSATEDLSRTAEADDTFIMKHYAHPVEAFMLERPFFFREVSLE